MEEIGIWNYRQDFG